MRISVLLREAIASARAQLVPTALVAVLVGVMCLTTILTVGRAAAAQDRVRERLEEAGSRQIEIVDEKDLGFLTTSVVGSVSAMDTVERAAGLTLPSDVTNVVLSVGGAQVPYWQVVGDLADVVELTSGRWPGAGEALASSTALTTLGMDAAVGAVYTGADSPAVAIVGTFRARQPFDELSAGVVGPADEHQSAHRLDVVATTAGSAQLTQSAVVLLLARSDSTDLGVTSPQSLADIQEAVVGDLSRYNQWTLVAVLGSGALLVAIVSLSDVLLRRRDLGRRRALGAARWVLTTLVVVRALVAATLGAVVACLAGVVATARMGQTPEPGFVVATAVLAILTAGAASLVPAVVAARQDPVRVLRTP